MIEPDQQWYVDAIDPIGGLCFASRRIADLEQDADLDLVGVYISPPQFQPEQVASRAISFSAARGGFQLGLFLDAAEVGFPSLPSLVEFVRRCYISGGRTDGAGGRGPLPVPPRPGGGKGGFEPLDLFEREGAGAFADVMKVLQNFSIALKQASGGPVPITDPWEEKVPDEGEPTEGDDIALAGAAATLIAELLVRMPRPEIGEDWRIWVECATRLRQAIAGLGLHGLILRLHGRELVKSSDHAAQRTKRAVVEPSELYGVPIHLLWQYFGLPVGQLPWPEEFWSAWPIRQGAVTDPVDDLSCWPLPAWLGSSDMTSVLDLLSAMTASPDSINAPQVQAVAIALFAAVHVTRRPLPEWPPETADGAIAMARRKQVLRAAGWLIAQFPRFAFPPAIEKLIASVGTVSKESPDNGYAFG